jgi:hypothetical protein
MVVSPSSDFRKSWERERSRDDWYFTGKGCGAMLEDDSAHTDLFYTIRVQ